MGCATGAGVEVRALGDYWHRDRDERTELGLLVHLAKDLNDSAAARELAERFASLAPALKELKGSPLCLVAPVPSIKSAESANQLRLPYLLAEALAAAAAGEYRPDLLVKPNPTPRLRSIEPQHRAEVVARAGYRVAEPVEGRGVVLVDDVVLTATTLDALAACVRESGAASVVAAVAARTRRIKDRV